MTLGPYPTYRDSDIEWLDAVPSEWVTNYLKHLGMIYYGLGEPPKYVDEGVALIRATNVFAGKISPRGMVFVNPDDIPTARIFWLNENDIIVVRSGAYTGDSAIIRSEYVGSIAGFDMVFRANPLVDADFIQFCLLSPYVKSAQIDMLRMRAAQPHLNSIELGECRISMPPLSEQIAIAAFLNHETAEIDAFIADQEKLIALLNERRAATITQAVTKGLDPNVPMKDSGVVWLGMIPRDWSIRGIKAAAATVGGSGFPHEYQGIEDEEIPFHKVSALAGAGPDGVIRNSKDTISRATAKVLGAKILPSGTIVMAKIGAALLLGRMRSVDRSFCIDNNMLALVPHQGYVARYLIYALQIVSFDLIVNPGAVPSLDMTAFRDYPLAFPEQEEQQSIVDFIDSELTQIDAALADAREAIALSRERRSALISAAVTGKIDVRDAMTSERELFVH